MSIAESTEDEPLRQRLDGDESTQEKALRHGQHGAESQERQALRQAVYGVLIALSAGAMLGRILAVDSVDRLAIQRDRVARITADLTAARQDLEKQGLSSTAIEEQLKTTEEELRRKARVTRPFLSANDRSRWCTVRALVEPEMRVDGFPYAIDKVLDQPHWDTIDMVYHDGHYYSSKPPLPVTLLAAEYWIIHRLTGLTLGTHPYAVGRFMLVTVSLIPLLFYFFLVVRLVERFGRTDWGRVYAVAAATLATFLTTFAVALNNHLPAAVWTLATLYPAVRIWVDGERRIRYFVLAGLFGALTVTFELPALSLFALVSAALLWKAPKQTLLAYMPPALVVTAAFFATNWIAHQSLRPPYLHHRPGDNWYAYEWKGRPSYWQDPKGIDRGEVSPGVYAFHTLVGHHGIFSLTPIWLLSAAGLGIWLRQRDQRALRELALAIAAVSVVCLAFYLLRSQHDRNYGGTASGFRWVFWLAPLWLVSMLPALDAMASRRWMRGLALVLLFVSMVSVAYPTWNPWTHPVISDLFQQLGWANY